LIETNVLTTQPATDESL